MFYRIAILIFALLTAKTAFCQNLMHIGSYPSGNTYSAELDGSNVTLLSNTTDATLEFEIDITNSRRYWTAFLEDTISRSDYFGDDLTVLYDASDGVNNAFGIAIDVTNGRLFWAEWLPSAGGGRIRCANIDGTGSITDVLTGVNYPAGVEIDLANGHLYYAESVSRLIRRANLGTGCAALTSVTTLVTIPAPARPYALHLDVANNKMYWTDSINDRIGTSNLDGSSPNYNLWTGLGTGGPAVGPTGMDLRAGELYWSEYSTNRTRKANADGTGGITNLITTGITGNWGLSIVQSSSPEVFVNNSISPESFDLGDTVTYTILVTNIGNTNLTGISVTDTFQSELVDVTWTCSVNTGGGSCANSSGSGDINETVDLNVSGQATYTVTATVDASAGPTMTNTANISHGSDTLSSNNSDSAYGYRSNPHCMYLTENNTGTRTASVEKDGDNFVIETTTPTGGSYGIEADYGGGVYYWTSFVNDTINRANLDGSGVTTLHAAAQGVNEPAGLAHYVANSRLYWAQVADNTIRCGRTSGAGSTSVVASGLNSPRGVAIDTVNNRLYWTETGGTDKIVRGDLANNCGALTNITTVLSAPGTPLNDPYAIAVDNIASKIYWSEYGDGTIGTANLDGSSPNTSLFTSIATPTDLEIDEYENLLYWVESNAYLMRRAPADGSVPPQTLTDFTGTGISTLDKPWGVALCEPSTIDIEVVKTAVGDFRRGETANYTIVVTNNGPSNVTNLGIVDIFPNDYTNPVWTCLVTGVGACGTPAGVGDINQNLILNSGAFATFSVSGTIAASTESPLINWAGVNIPATTTDTDDTNDADDATSLLPRRIYISD